MEYFGGCFGLLLLHLQVLTLLCSNDLTLLPYYAGSVLLTALWKPMSQENPKVLFGIPNCDWV